LFRLGELAQISTIVRLTLGQLDASNTDSRGAIRQDIRPLLALI
jgi:hypothetical protein